MKIRWMSSLIAASCLAGFFYSFDAAGLTWTLDRFLLMGLVAACIAIDPSLA